MKHAGAADGHIQRRLKRDIGHRVRRLPRAVVRDPRLAAGDLAYLSGLLAGIAQWTLWERR
jgi:hypothetical protein